MKKKKRTALAAPRLAMRAARAAAGAERGDEDLARQLVERRAAAQAAALEGRAVDPLPRRGALLVINTKSGPNDDSIRHLRRLVDLLTAHGIDVVVRVKLRKRQARQDVREAVRQGCRLVIAAGGDGTVGAVAHALIGTNAVLGIIPLGTYNNVATALGVPTDPAAACALIAAGPTRAVDVGLVLARGRKKPRPFFEMASVGLAAALAPVGQKVKDGDWPAAASALPAMADMPLASTTLQVDGDSTVRSETILLTVSNTSRSAASLAMAPEARMDDGLLDVAVYDGMSAAAIALHFAAAKTVGAPNDGRIRRLRARRVDVQADPPMPVAADSKVIGTTPARISVLVGALTVVAGHGPDLGRPVSASLVMAAISEGDTATPQSTAHSAQAGVAARTIAAVAEPVFSFIEERILHPGQHSR